jgi:hypothetical protein
VSKVGRVATYKTQADLTAKIQKTY